MWTNWRPDRLNADFARIAALGANTVREIIPANVFGYPQPEAVYLARMREFVDIAARNGLHVQLTLFDWWSDYADIEGSESWTDAVLRPFAGDPRVAFVELQNELPLTDAAVAWARAMILFAHSVLGTATPVTVSVAGAEPVARLKKLMEGLGAVRPDFFDLHYYFGGNGGAAYTDFRAAKHIVSPTPLWIGETGYPSTVTLSGFAGVPLTTSAQEAAQAHYFATVEWASKAAGLGPAGVWVLDNFFPDAVPTWDGQNFAAELNFGLYRTDGSAKPAASVVRAAFKDHLLVGFNGGFETTVKTAAGVTVPAVWGPLNAGATVTSDRALQRSGKASVRITVAGDIPGVGSLLGSPADGGVRPGDRVQISAWARRSTSDSSVRLDLQWVDNAGKVIGHQSAAPRVAGESIWAPVSVTAKAPLHASYVRIELVARLAGGSVWFDDVNFEVSRQKSS